MQHSCLAQAGQRALLLTSNSLLAVQAGSAVARRHFHVDFSNGQVHESSFGQVKEQRCMPALQSSLLKGFQENIVVWLSIDVSGSHATFTFESIPSLWSACVLG